MADDISIAAVIVRAELAEFKKSMATLGPAAAAAGADMTKALLKELRAIERGSASSMDAVGKAHKKAGDEAAKAAAKAGNSWNAVAKRMQSNQLISDAEQIGSVFTLMGGSISKVSMLFVSLVRPVAMVTEILGPKAPLLLGLLAIPAALLAVPVAAKKMADALLEIGRSGVRAKDDIKGLISKENSDALDSLAVSFANLDKRSQVWSGNLAAELSPAITAVVNTTIGFEVALNRIATAFDGVGETKFAQSIQALSRSMLMFTSFGLTEALVTIEDFGAEMNAQTSGSLRGYLHRIEVLKPALEKLEDPLVRAARLMDEAWDAAEKRAIAAARATETVGDVIDESLADLLTAEGKIEEAHGDRIERVYESGATAEEVDMAILASAQRRDRDLAELDQSRWKSWEDTVDKQIGSQEELDKAVLESSELYAEVAETMADLMEDTIKHVVDTIGQAMDAMSDVASDAMDYVGTLNEIYIDALGDRVDKQRDAAQAAYDDWLAGQEASQSTWLEDEQNKIDKLLQTGQISSQEADKQRRLLEKNAEAADAILEQQKAEKLAAIDQIGAAEQAAATKAFEANQRLQIAQAFIESIRAGISLIPAFSFLGPFAPVAAAGAAGVAFLAAEAQIASATPPELPTGLSTDHHVVGLQNQELVASRRAAADPAVRQAINAGNEGRRVSGGDDVRVAVSLDPRTGRLRLRRESLGKRSRRGR